MKESYPREVEATLIIQSEKPDEIVMSIAGLESIGDYGLIREKSRAIRDVYFDTPDQSLSSRKISLRLRELDGQYRITMKSQVRLNQWGALDRQELEFSWSQTSLERIFCELADSGIVLNQPNMDFDNTHPMDILLKSSLKPIQHRESHRQVRNVVIGESSPIAELVIDSVIYHFHKTDIHHYEIEIETKKEENIEVFMTLIDDLLAMYKPYLRRWKYGKLVTGKAIEKLLEEGSLDKLISHDNNLKPVTYTILEFSLGSGLA